MEKKNHFDDFSFVYLYPKTCECMRNCVRVLMHISRHFFSFKNQKTFIPTLKNNEHIQNVELGTYRKEKQLFFFMLDLSFVRFFVVLVSDETMEC